MVILVFIVLRLGEKQKHSSGYNDEIGNQLLKSFGI